MNYGTITIPKGTIGYESINGHGNWWYPDNQSPRELPINAAAEHMFSWRNQDPYFVFKVHMCVFKPEQLFEKPKYVTIWLHKEDIDAILDRPAV